MNKFLLFIFFQILIIPATVFAQKHHKTLIDTIPGSDTLVERKYTKSGSLDWEGFYYKNKLIYQKWHLYNKHSFGYVKVTNKKCKNEKVEYFEFYPDSQIKRYELKPGWKVKETRTYYDSGGIESIDYYAQNKMDTGIGLVFHRNGQIWTKWLFVNKRLMAVVFNYDKNGKSQDTGNFKNGKGNVNIYDDDGKLVEILYFYHGKFKKVRKPKTI